jgi:hypothetical protein
LPAVVWTTAAGGELAHQCRPAGPAVFPSECSAHQQAGGAVIVKMITAKAMRSAQELGFFFIPIICVQVTKDGNAKGDILGSFPQFTTDQPLLRGFRAAKDMGCEKLFRKSVRH